MASRLFYEQVIERLFDDGFKDGDGNESGDSWRVCLPIGPIGSPKFERL